MKVRYKGFSPDLTYNKVYSAMNGTNGFFIMAANNGRHSVTVHESDVEIVPNDLITPGEVKKLSKLDMKSERISNFLNKQKESVNHPSHYNAGKIEVIDIIEDADLNFSLGNAVKYILRAKYKGTELEDLKKALWYVQREIERLEK